MQRAEAQLKIEPQHLLIDGNRFTPYKNIPHTTIAMEPFMGSEPDYNSIKAAMKSERKNIFIPTSGNETTLSSLLASMLIIKNDTVNNLPEFTLFGYPEWQIYANSNLEAMYEVDTYFYASFFTNNILPEAVDIQARYAGWYNRSQTQCDRHYE